MNWISHKHKSIALLVAMITGALSAELASAAVTASILDSASFPTAADFQTFNPFDPATPTNGERTVREEPNVTTLPEGFNGTRHITQTFQLDSGVTIDTIDIMFVRGNSGNTGILRFFDVANTRGDVFTDDFNDAVANGFLLDIQFTMPVGLDPASNVEQTLRLNLTGADRITLPAMEGPAGYAFSLSSAVDGNTAVNSEVFTWRMGEGPDGANNTARLNNSWYVPGRVMYDDFNGANNTERRRDGLFALSGAPLVPGDVNGDGFVMMDDFDIIRANFRQSPAARSEGDLSGDSLVSLFDFVEWKGAFLGGGGSLAGLNFNFTSVPEPSSVLLAMVAMLGLTGCRWSRRGR